jgi:hypothetical protein
MADEKTVSVTSLKWHTRGGSVHPEGSTYEAHPSEIENLTGQRLVRVNLGEASTAAAPLTTETGPAAARTHDYATTTVGKKRKTSLGAKRKT